jgi:hypothetical protein
MHIARRKAAQASGDASWAGHPRRHFDGHTHGQSAGLHWEKLDPKAKRQTTQLVDTFIEREELKRRVNAQGA